MKHFRNCIAATVALGLAVGITGLASADTSQDFDNPGTPFVGASFGPRPAPTIVGPDGFSTGQYLRLLFKAPFPMRTQNGVGFDLSDAGAFNRIIADFDFRITCAGARFGFGGGGCADGFSFLLLDTAVHGISGAPQPTLAEHGVLTLQSQFSLGFNTYQNGALPADDGSSNSISMHVNGNIVPGSPTALSLDTYYL